MKTIKTILLLQSLFCQSLSSFSQPTSYGQFTLNGFGLVTVPIFMDTLGEKVHKSIISDRIESLEERKIIDLNNILNTNLSKNLLENTLDGTHRFWKSSTLNYFIDTALIILNEKKTRKKIDYNKLQLVPNISLKRDNNPVSSNFMISRVFLNRDSTKAFLNLIENIVGKSKATLSNAQIVETKSSYSLFESIYPIVKASCFYRTSEGMDYIIDFYFLYRNNYRYSIKFEYLKENSNSWEEFIKKFITNFKPL